MMWFIFDTETTGLVKSSLIEDMHQPRIVEFYGALVGDFGHVHRDLGFRCKPPKGVVWQKDAIDATGIDQEAVKDEQPFSHYAPQVLSMIAEAQGMVAHNLAFDFYVVAKELERCGMSAQWPIQRICTVRETEWIKGYRLSLSNLHEHLFGEKFEGAHAAKVDVTALIRCFAELQKEGNI